MDYIFTLGPIEDMKGRSAWFGFSLTAEGEMRSADAPTEEGCVRALVRKGRPTSLAEASSRIARAVGIESGPLPEAVMAFRAHVAVVLGNPAAELDPKVSDSLASFLEVLPEVLGLDPAQLGNEDVLMFDRQEGKRVVGYSAGTEIDSDGNLTVTVIPTDEAKAAKRGPPKDVIIVQLTPEPEALVGPLQEMYGLDRFPTFLRVKNGKPGKVTAKDLEVLTDAMVALLEEAEQSGGVHDEAAEELSNVVPIRGSVGRNDPCPCGSGKKYKKCHLGKEPTQAPRPAPHPIHELDARLRDLLGGYAKQKWPGWLERTFDGLVSGHGVAEDQILLQWLLFVARGPLGLTVAQAFSDERGAALGAELRRWLKAQLAGRLSIWEVAATNPALGRVMLRDLVNGDEAEIHEVAMAESLNPLDRILARVVDAGDVSVVAGAHGHVLPPPFADEVMDEWLIAGADQESLLDRWRQGQARRSAPPESGASVVNADGEAVVLCEQRFALGGIDPTQAMEAILEIPGARGDDPKVVSFERPGPGLLVDWIPSSLGQLRVEGRSLVLSTNSKERAERLRRALEGAVPGLTASGTISERAVPSLGPQRIFEGHATNQFSMHLAEAELAWAWPMTPLPTLGQRTPTAAMKDEAGRKAVLRLLLVEEWHAHRDPRPDALELVQRKRERLGLEGPGAAPLAKLSDALLIMVAPILHEERAEGFDDAKPWIEHASEIWNASVFAETGSDPRLLADLRALKSERLDRIIERKARFFAGDTRVIGAVEFTDAGLAVKYMASPPPKKSKRPKASRSKARAER